MNENFAAGLSKLIKTAFLVARGRFKGKNVLKTQEKCEFFGLGAKKFLVGDLN